MDFLQEEFDEILKIFQVESEEIISRLNNSLFELEKNPNNRDAIFVLFRDAHSLKGAARMIGFNNVQTLSHKIEDILGLAKDNKLKLNTKIVNVLYKTVDFLNEIIQKSIERKQEIYSEKIAEQIANLEEIKNLPEEDPTGSEKSEFDLNILKATQKRINTLFSESFLLLMKIEIEKNNKLIGNLIFKIQELYDIFKEIGHFEIRKGLEDILLKLDFVNKSSQELTENESEELLGILNSLTEKLTSICELQNLEVVDYYAYAFDNLNKILPSEDLQLPEPASRMQKTPGVELVIEHPQIKESFSEPEVIQPEEYPGFSKTKEDNELSLIRNKVIALVQNSEYLVEIKESLIAFEENTTDASVKEIIKIILKILDFTGKNEIMLNEDSISVIEQSIEFCDNKLKNKVETADKELIIQRLEIVKQLLELNANETFLTEFQKMPPGKSKKITDFSNLFDSGEIKTLRVDSTKLDSLINQVGELITTKVKTKKHLHQLDAINKNLEEWQRNSNKTLTYLKYYDKKYFSHLEYSDSPTIFIIKQLLNLYAENNKKFSDATVHIAKLQRTIIEDDMKTNLMIDDLEVMVKNIRILPLATIFHLFGRMVRDIAQEVNKQINLEIIGSETCTDKKIIEEIKSPLIHIIRNSIDHGIETPEERIAMGKPPEGKIVIRAKQIDNRLFIEIQDDGRGINLEKIKEKAIRKGYLREEEAKSMTDEQITNLIFAPGFSTGEEITNISGRGIGLDVVQTKISQLNGTVRVISELNKGCCVQIELPTTMSTLKSFLVRTCNQTFAIPMSAINVVMLKKTDEIFTKNGNKTIIFNEKTIPLYNLADVLNLKPNETTTKKPRATVLIIEQDNKTLAIAVDNLIGDQEITQKKLSAPLYKLKNISGLTTLASGEICLIINISELVKNISQQKNQHLESKKQNALADKSKPHTVLLVDDSITTRTLEKTILTKAGYQVKIATNPIEAFEKMKNQRFDLIISDIEMPEMSGFEFLNKIKTDEMYFEIPVIMVSSLLTEEIRKKAKELGAEGYITKGSFNQDDFLLTISNIIEKHEQ